MTKNNSKVLVVAPEFPLINQPWMDTYLEQLVLNNINFSVFSLNRNPKNYNTKVGSLNLLDYTHAYDISRTGLLSSVKKRFNGFYSVKTLIKIRQKKILKSLSGIKLLFYILYFYSIRDECLNVAIIHSHSEVLSHRFIVLAEILDVPLIVTFHGLPPQGVPQLVPEKRKELYQYAHKVIVNTDFAKKQVLAFGCSADKVVVLPQGLPIGDFPFKPAPLPLNGEPLRMLSVGRFHRDKGQHYSMLALKRLLNDGVRAQWSFVGSGPDLVKLQALACMLGINEHVTFHEKLSSEELLDQYSRSHIFVLASIDTPGGHVETQGVVLQEAQASGCLVIATRTGGIPECLSHNCDSLLVKQQSSRAIYSAIKYFYSNPEHWDIFRKRGLENVKQNFSSSVIGREMAKLLEQG